MRNFFLIILFSLVFFIVSTEASRRGRRRSRNGRRPKISNEDPTIKFRLAVEKYKKLREQERMSESSLAKREEVNGMDEITRVNLLLLLGKHDPSQRSLFELNGDSLFQNEYILETERDDSISPDEVNNNFIIGNNSQRKMAYKVRVKTVVKTYKKTIATNIKTTSSKKIVTKKVYTTIKKTTKRTSSVTTKKVTKTTVKSTVATNKAVPVSSASSSSNANGNINSYGVYQPKPGTKFQWQLSNCEKVNTSVNADIFDIDLFETPESKIKELKKKGKKVICYFSGGTI